AKQDDEIRRLIASKDAAEREFLRLTRELVIVGYFTSEKIGKTLLRYDPVPGRYDADIPLSETGDAAWNRP
ncbi:MAG: gluconate 2-dehydrogenase subunit 3 family protein, partial [Opitutaceae bacterium]